MDGDLTARLPMRPYRPRLTVQIADLIEAGDALAELDYYSTLTSRIDATKAWHDAKRRFREALAPDHT